ncbi:MAG TPA: nucleotide pyrophosphohydrolase [Candidatus Thermoplasmatota archaeon]|nr:nucleotide pyrophosphohydrolase [Candidatus Thermoplasmatota archaeon]
MAATLQELSAAVLAFRDERDWKQFHGPKDTAIGLMLEAAEVLELVQWKRDGDPVDRARLGEELADVLAWVLILAHDQGLDLAEELRRKLEKNARNYPVEKARGVARKYTDL